MYQSLWFRVKDTNQQQREVSHKCLVRLPENLGFDISITDPTNYLGVLLPSKYGHVNKQSKIPAICSERKKLQCTMIT